MSTPTACNRLRVLHVLPIAAARAGGYVSFALQASVAMQGNGVVPTIFASDLATLPTARTSTRLQIRDLPYGAATLDVHLARTRAPYRLVNSWELWHKLPRAVRHADLVHIHSLWLAPQLIAFLGCRLSNTPYIVSPHGALDPYLRERGRVRKRLTDLTWQRDMLARADALHVTTDEEASLIRDIAPKVPRIVVPVGINIAEYEQLPDPAAFRGRFLGGHEGPVILFLGRITFKKGLDVLLRAFATCSPAATGVILAVVGPDDEGLTPSLVSLARELEITANVRFIPALFGRDKLGALAAADVWALTSHTENFGVSVLEAAAAGRAIIVSDQVNLGSALSHCAAGVVVPLDHKVIGASIRQLLNDRVWAQRLGESARTFASGYDWNVIAPQLAGHYRRVVEERRLARSH